MMMNVKTQPDNSNSSSTGLAWWCLCTSVPLSSPLPAAAAPVVQSSSFLAAISFCSPVLPHAYLPAYLRATIIITHLPPPPSHKHKCMHMQMLSRHKAYIANQQLDSICGRIYISNQVPQGCVEV